MLGKAEGESMKEFFNNDKNLVIVAVTVLTLTAMFILKDPAAVLSNTITGLFGVAVGKALV